MNDGKPTFTTSVGQAMFDMYVKFYPDHLVPPKAAGIITHLKPATLATLRSRGGGPEYVRYGSQIFYVLTPLIQWFESRMEHHS